MKNLHLIEQQPLLSEMYKDPPHFVQKREIAQKYTRKSPAMKKAKHALESSAGLSTPFYNVTDLSFFQNSLIY